MVVSKIKIPTILSKKDIQTLKEEIRAFFKEFFYTNFVIQNQDDF
jgi:hypothetical protein